MESLNEMNSTIQNISDFLNRNNKTNYVVDMDTKNIPTNIDIIIERLRKSIEIIKTDSTSSLSTPPFLNELYYLQLSEWAQKLLEDEITYIESVDPYSGEERYRLQQSFENRQLQFSVLSELTKEFQSLMPNLEMKLARVKKYNDTFDSDDKTNPLIFELKFINDLHREFDGYLWETMDIDSFKNCFRIAPKKLIKKDGFSFNEFCYFLGCIEYKQIGVSSFPNWVTAYHVNGNFGKLKVYLKDMADSAKDLRDGFSLTIPQKKAIEIMEEIDNRFKQIRII